MTGGRRDRGDLLARAGCSDAVTWPEARDAVRPWQEVTTVQTPSGPRVRRVVYKAGLPGRVPSALDLVEARSRTGLCFTPAQHAAAAALESLTARASAGNVKLSRIEPGSGCGGGSAGVSEATLDALGRLRAMWIRIGNAPVLVSRPAQAICGRRTIRARALVEHVVVWRGLHSEVLMAHGWAVQSVYVARLNAALADAMNKIDGI